MLALSTVYLAGTFNHEHQRCLNQCHHVRSHRPIVRMKRVQKSGSSSSSSSKQDRSKARCQKCLQDGHWTFECKNERVYRSRPSHTDALRQVRHC
jgi:hypothetical protein